MTYLLNVKKLTAFVLLGLCLSVLSCISIEAAEKSSEKQSTKEISYSTEGKEVIIPDGVTEISSFAFYYNRTVEKVTIPDSVTKIGDRAFEGCTSLKEISGGNNIKSIGFSAFYGCTSLKRFPFTKKLVTIGSYGFSNCKKLETATLYDSVKSVGTDAFSNCIALKSVRLSSGMTKINNYMFYNCSSLTSVTIPSSIILIKEHAFGGCKKLQSVKIPSGMKTIQAGAFMKCSSLVTIELPKSVYKVGRRAFTDLKYMIAPKGSIAERCAKEENIAVKNSSATGLHKTRVSLLVKDKDMLYFHKKSSGTVKWGTTNKKVVTVSNGKITAINTGTAKVYAVFNNKKYSCTVTVLKRTVDNRFKQVEANYELKNATDYKKIWAVNHWLAYNVTYKLNVYGAETALLKGQAKCDGYAWAFYEFMRYFKIPVDYVSSIKANHAWNIVQINSKWYHIDTTNNTDYNIYEAFLITDSAMKKRGYVADYKNVKCTSTTTDKKFKSPQLNKTYVTLKKGQKYKLKFINNSKKVRWFSFDSSVAKVDKYGNVRAVKKGTAVIDATIIGRDANYQVTIKVK